MRLTFGRLFSIGMWLLALFFAGSLLFSALLSRQQVDWLDGRRYVRLTAARYPAGSVTHFDLRSLKPPRNTGFFLIAGDEHYVAVSDRARCLMEYRPENRDLYSPCDQRSYPVERILAGDFANERGLVVLPVERRGDRLVIDLQPLLPGARF